MTIDPESETRSGLLQSAILACVLVLLCGGLSIYIFSDPDFKYAFLFPKIAKEVQDSYDGTVDWDRAVALAQEAMFSQLDRYSGYIDPREFNQMEEELSGGYSGIGVSVIKDELGLLVMSVREHGPSAEAGILNGDIILAADSVDFAPLSVDQASNHLRGYDSTKVRLQIFRSVTGDTLELSVVRQRIPLEHVPFAGYTDDSLIYIRLLDFEAGASTDVRDAIDSLIAKPHAKPRGLLLDLRGNPGGLFEEAIATVNLFVKRGQFIVGTSAHSKWQDERHYATGEDITGGLPMAVLVDRGSASSSEITSGALHQLKRAILVGDTTFGKGLVQGFTQYPDGSGIKVTVSRYFLEGNLFLNRIDSSHSDTGSGIAPDYLAPNAKLSPFLMDIESSLLLSKFAYGHQDEIIAGSPVFGPESSWVEQFAIFAGHEKFLYTSRQTQDAELLVFAAKEEQSARPVLAEAEKMLQISKRDDLHEFQVNADYIEMRLKELALERKFGIYRAYGEAIVNRRPDIKLAARLLRGGGA